MVRFDPACFDRARPRTDAQRIAVRFEEIPTDGPKDPPEACSDGSDARLPALLKEIDWRTLQEMAQGRGTPATARATTIGRDRP